MRLFCPYAQYGMTRQDEQDAQSLGNVPELLQRAGEPPSSALSWHTGKGCRRSWALSITIVLRANTSALFL